VNLLITCYRPSGTYGVLSTNVNAYMPAYATATGWDFATGIGTVNAYNPVTNWPESPTFGGLYAKAPDFNGDGKSDILWRCTDGTGAT
jgi:hypothetical protein